MFTFIVMCNHKYRDANLESCQLYYAGKLINYELPIDNKGFCFFHSSSALFRSEYDFEEELQKTINWLDENSKAPKYDFSEIRVGLIGEQLELTKLSLRKDLYFNDAVFFSQIVFYGLSTDCRLVFDTAAFESGLKFKSCVLSTIDLSYVTLAGFLTLDKVELVRGHLILIRAKLAQSHIIRDSVLDANLSYFESEFHGLVFTDNTFKGRIDFEAAIISTQFIMANCGFTSNVDFIDAVFDITAKGVNDRFEPIDFYQLELAATAFFNFKGKAPQSMLRGSTRIDFLNGECAGRIQFVNVNLSYLLPASKEKLFSLVREDKVLIGSGCLKYRVQTPIITIDAGAINENIVNELTASFVNYFIFSNGFNLGVEFVSKQINAIQFFYYTDEDISMNEFHDRLKLSEKAYWTFSVSNAEVVSEQHIASQIDNYISKASILSKIKLRKDYGLWNDADTQEVLKAITFGDKPPDTTTINLYIDKLKINTGTEINNPLITGNRNQFADKILNAGQEEAQEQGDV